MPLQHINLARGHDNAATAAAGPSSSADEKFTATPDELRVIQEKMKDPVFVELMHDYMKSLEDPETRKEEEAYLAQAEREAREGGDFSFEFVFPRPAYVVELLQPSNTRVSAAEAKRLGVRADALACQPPARSFLNICGSDKVKAFTERTTGDRNGSNWEVPVSVSQRRVEVYTPIASSPSAKIPTEYAASPSSPSAEAPLCIVHDVVFHPSTLALAERSNRFLCFLTEIAVEHLNSGYGESNGFPFRRLPSSILSIGTPQNQTLRTQRGATPFAVDPRDKVLERPTKHLPDSRADSAAAAGTTATAEPTPAAAAAAPPAAAPATQLPPHTIAHRGSIDLTDAWQWKVSDKRIGVPEELVVSMTFAEVRRAAALDITITPDGHAVRIDKTAEQQQYEGVLVLPFTVEETPRQAKFDRTRGLLTLTLTVVPPPLPEGATTAEELRRALLGGINGDAEQAGGTVATTAPPLTTHAASLTATQEKPEDEGNLREAITPNRAAGSSAAGATKSSSAPPPPTVPAEQQEAGQVEEKAASTASPSTAASKPEVGHIADQDRVAAMMAQVQAARAAREAAAAHAASEEAPSAVEQPPQPIAEEPQQHQAQPSSVDTPEERHNATDAETKSEDIPFIRKAPAATTVPITTAAPTSSSTDAVDDELRARQQAWAAMMESEMHLAKVREEAEAARAAKATELQAAKTRRKLAAEKEQERLTHAAQVKRAALPLSNKYIFSID